MLHVTHLAPKFVSCFLDFWKFCAALPYHLTNTSREYMKIYNNNLNSIRSSVNFIRDEKSILGVVRSKFDTSCSFVSSLKG